MRRFHVLIPFLLILATACDSDEKGCPERQTECNDGKCHDCCINDDCTEKIPDCRWEYIICNDDYECECVCYQGDEDCSRDPEACCAGLNCEMGTCRPPCMTDVECTLRYPYEPYSRALKCKDGICSLTHCVDALDCPGGQICLDWYCAPCDCPEVAKCVVQPGSAVTKQGTTAQFAATAYLQSGAVAPGYTYSWKSSNDSIATVDDTGLVTGGTDSGNATITASVYGCCYPSGDATVVNYGLMQSGSTRVVAVDEFSGSPIEGATVVLGNEAAVLTDANGVAEIGVELNDGNPQDITVSKRDYHYVTLKSVKTNDVIAHMSPIYHLSFSQDPPVKQAGGIKGKFDFGMIRCEEPLRTCDVSFGLAGLSIPPSLTRIGQGMLTGGSIKTEVDLGSGPEVILLGEGMVLCLNQTCFKEFYTPTGIRGNRVAWGLGGKLDLADLNGKLGMILAGDIDIELALLGLSPLLANFYTSIVPNLEIAPWAMVLDINDIDGDPATSEVPDYDNFPRQDMTLKIKMDQTMTFSAPALPLGVYDGVLVRGGIVVRGAGFVPLGLGIGVDSKDELDPPDGVIDDPIVLNVADVAGRIPEGQVQRVVIALAVKLEDDGGPERWAGQVLFVDSFSGTHTLPAFLPPVVASFDRVGRRLEISQMPVGVDLLQAVFAGENESSWHVLTGDFGSFDLPLAPPEGDRADSVGVYAVDLYTGGYQELVEFNDLNMGNVIENLGAFSYSEVP